MTKTATGPDYLLLGTHALITLTFAIVLFHAPFVTNDGPVHTAFAHLLATGFGGDLQGKVYQFNAGGLPNLMTDLFMAPIQLVLSPRVAESTVQVLCLTLPAWGAYFALNQIDRANAWLSLLVYSLALNQMFFFGLYSYCVSTSFFFFAMGLYLRFLRTGGGVDVTALGLVLILAYFTHAAGFIMAWVAVAAAACARGVLAAERGRWFRFDRRTWLCLPVLALPLAVLLAYSVGHGRSPVAYGVVLRDRLWQFATLPLLAVNRGNRGISHLLAIALLVGCGYCAWRLWRWERPLSGRGSTLLICAAMFLAAMAVMLLFPDLAGGGWTHFRRFVIYPYFVIVLALACQHYTRGVRLVFGACAAVACLYMFSRAVAVQAVIREQLQPFAAVDREVGTHCTVLPIVLRLRPPNPDARILLDYDPYFQETSALELHDDRVVLFNFLARLTVYPVRFKPRFEPQSQIFHWQPEQQETHIETMDIAGYEAKTGLAVDYLLLWGDPGEAPATLRPSLDAALAAATPVFRARNGLLTLYRRTPSTNGLCTAPAAG